MIKFSAPRFWSQKWHPLALLLWPVGEAYKAITALRLAAAKPPRVAIPVMCIGNATAGGVGKTPIVQDIARRLQAMGRQPHILMRGYGGAARYATRVDLALHDALDVGDEALLHAAIAPTWVGRNRHETACAALAVGADILLMDDGLQNTTLHCDVRWLLVDATAGIGNGYGIPAGPMREDFDAALARCDATILVHRGEAAAGPITGTAQAMQVSIRTLAHGVDSARPVYAFAGIGAPEKLIAGLRAAGLDVVGARGFPDHHPYRPDEIEALKKRALLLGAQLVTTQKDFVRLEADLRDGIVAVDVEVCWQDETRLEQMLRQVFDAA